LHIGAQLSLKECSDTPALLDVAAKWSQEEWGTSPEEFRASIASSPGRLPVWMAVCTQTPVGFVSMKWHGLENAKDQKLWINALYVVPAYRQQDAGRRLLAAAVDSARNAGEQKLYVYTANPGFYKLNGWCEYTKPAGEGISEGLTVLELALNDRG
jgi:GNAT superfamily N-acetyltransferase